MYHNPTTDRNLIDPRVAFVLVVYLTTSVIVLREAHRTFPVFLIALASGLLMRVNYRQLFYKLRRLWCVLLLVVLLQGIFNPSGTIWLQIGSVTLLTSGGFSIALTVLMRLATLIIGGSILSRYPNRVLIQGMIQLKLPYEFAYMVSVGIRFIPLSAQVFRDSLTAIQLRGVDMNKLKLKQRMQVYLYLLMPTVAMGLNNAQELSTAMELRGFRAYETRTSFFTLHMKTQDWILLGLIGLLTAATAAWNIWL